MPEPVGVKRNRPIPRLAAVAALFCMGLTGCKGESGKIASDARRIECAVGASGGWSRTCAIEKDGDILTVRHEDGGFRRLQLIHDGRGMIAADGAESAKVAIMDRHRIELSVGNDRYRFPATIAQAAR